MRPSRKMGYVWRSRRSMESNFGYAIRCEAGDLTTEGMGKARPSIKLDPRADLAVLHLLKNVCRGGEIFHRDAQRLEQRDFVT